MHCYKCNSEDELSAKKTDIHGNITFICKSCRRKGYETLKAKRPSHYTKAVPVSKEWIAKAKQKNLELSLKYRDTSFLEAKGMSCA